MDHSISDKGNLTTILKKNYTEGDCDCFITPTDSPSQITFSLLMIRTDDGNANYLDAVNSIREYITSDIRNCGITILSSTAGYSQDLAGYAISLRIPPFDLEKAQRIQKYLKMGRGADI